MAMSRGIAVFGSASMGALRAAELAAFGMIGVGRVFGDYARGAIEDDDEVALAHATAEFGYRSLSEPMVNIRYTLRRAESEGILGPGPCETLIAQVKRIPYPQRSFECVLDEAGGLGGGEREALRAWLPANRIDQKREDAVMMLRIDAAAPGVAGAGAGAAVPLSSHGGMAEPGFGVEGGGAG